MPAESARKVARQATWLAALNAHPDTGALRADGLRNLRKVAWAQACWMGWGTGTSRPTEEQLAAQTRLDVRTVRRWRRWLRERGLLERLEIGSTPRYRDRLQRALLGRVGNRASLYRHAVPGEVSEPAVDLAGDETVPPSLRPCVARSQNARARGTRSPLRGGGATGAPFELRRSPRTGAERLAACERLRAESPTLRRVTARRLRHVLRPWLLTGWTVRGVQHALDHRPDGAPWRIPFRPDELGNPAGWVVHRMRAWRDAQGAPLPDRYAVPGPRARLQSGSEDEDRDDRDDHRDDRTILLAAVERRPPTASFRAAREALRTVSAWGGGARHIPDPACLRRSRLGP